MLQMFYQRGHRARLEPVVAGGIVVKGIQQAEWRVDILAVGREMVSVVVLFQHSIGIFRLYTEIPGHGFNILGQIAPDLLLRQSADVIVSRIHGDVVKVVQIAEHADLSELGHTCQKDKLQMRIGSFEDGIESFEDITMLFFQQDLLPIL